MTETSACINNNFIRDPTSAATTTTNSNSTSTTTSSSNSLHPSNNSMKTHQSQSSPQQQMEQQTQPQRRLIKADLDLLYSLDTRVSTFFIITKHIFTFRAYYFFHRSQFGFIQYQSIFMYIVHTYIHTYFITVTRYIVYSTSQAIASHKYV